MAARISIAPNRLTPGSLSPWRVTPNSPAKAGSEARIRAVRAGGAWRWAYDCTQNASALAITAVMASADQSMPESGTARSPMSAAPTRQTTPQTPSWTVNRAPTACRRTPASVARMCAAKANAHPSASPSPSGCQPAPNPASSASPTAETPAPIHVARGTRARSTAAARSGVMTTNRPVMKPALAAVVCSRAAVCSTYPTVRKAPITRPARQPAGDSSRSGRQKTMPTITAAARNR